MEEELFEYEGTTYTTEEMKTQYGDDYKKSCRAL